MTLDRTDIISVVLALGAGLGYLGLVITGEIDFDAGYAEVLLIVLFSAVGIDTTGDWTRDIAEAGETVAEELLDETDE